MTAGYSVASDLLKVMLLPTGVSNVLMTIMIDYLICSTDFRRHSRLIFRHDGEIVLSFEQQLPSSLTHFTFWILKNRDCSDIEIIQTLELNAHLFRVKRVGLKTSRIPTLEDRLNIYSKHMREGYALEIYVPSAGHWILAQTESIFNPCFKKSHELDVIKLWMAALLISNKKSQLHNLNSIHKLRKLISRFFTNIAVIRPTQVFQLDMWTLLICRFAQDATLFYRLRFFENVKKSHWVMESCTASPKVGRPTQGFSECVLTNLRLSTFYLQTHEHELLAAYKVHNAQNFSVEFTLDVSQCNDTGASRLCLALSKNHPQHNTSIIVV